MGRRMAKILIVPGLSGSGPTHWQTRWQELLPDTERVEQSDWDHPKRAPWVNAFLSAVDRARDPIVVAHSLGCVVVAHGVRQRPDLKVQCALLVAPPDVDNRDHIEDILRDFAPMPLDRFPFRTVLVASRNDPYVKLERARSFAMEWGAEFVDLGAQGHINADSRLGDWPEGLAIFNRLTGGFDA